MPTNSVQSMSLVKQPLAIITGANSGFGNGLTRILLEKGFEVIMLCRSIETGNAAIHEMKLSNSNGKPVVMQIDLANLTTVVEFVKEYNQRYEGRVLKYLVLNAGVVKLIREITSQGLEEMVGVNHFGGVALFNLLLKSVLIPSKTRVVAVGSLVHKNATINQKNYHNIDLTGIKEETYSITDRYADSKLLNTLWGFQVQKRYYEKYGISCNSVHPGSGLFTNLGRRDASTAFRMVIVPLLGILLPVLWCIGFSQTWHDGGVAELAACEMTEGGKYLYRQYPSTASPTAMDENIQNWCWEETKRILKESAEKYNLPPDIAGFE